MAGRLHAMGWRGKDMPTKVMFRDLCGALRASGYDADAAANLWDKCLRYEPEAIEQLRRDTGLYGVLHLSQFFEPLVDQAERGGEKPSRKRKMATKSKKPISKN